MKRFVNSQILVKASQIIHQTQQARALLHTTPDIYTTNTLINKHAKSGDLHHAHKLFDEMPHKNIVSWTALISGYAQHRKPEQCFTLFAQMLSHCRPNDFAYASVLSVCDYSRSAQVHTLSLKTGFGNWVYVGNALVSMYWRNGDNLGVEASRVFDEMEFRNLVTYNSMITGYGIHKQGHKAMILFVRMCRKEVEVDETTLLGLVSCLSGNDHEGHVESVDTMNIRCCLQLHCVGIKRGLMSDVRVITAVVKAYSFLGGELGDCDKLFFETSSLHRDVVLWTEMISVFADKDPERSLFLFNQLHRDEMVLDCHVFSVALKSCASLVTERHASTVHSQVIKVGFVNVLVLDNVLIHAYARCGTIDKARKVFDEMVLRDIVSWNSMLKAYAVHGKGEEALKLFKEMDVEPDEITFVALFSACSHAGLVKEGKRTFDEMYEKHGILPQLDHYACMVDMLGRAGHVKEADDLVRAMPMEPDYVVWSALLGACRKHGETQLADLASSKLKDLNPGNSLGYVLMSNIYSCAGSFDKAGSIRRKMGGLGVKKQPGLSWTEVDGQIHDFASGGQRHPQKEDIFVNLENMVRELRNIGYVPETSLVMRDLEEEQKEEQLYHHSEKLALVFALMNARDNNSFKGAIRIMKNIRICLDCHNFMRSASKLVQREIIVRDSNRFHHFKEGVCSCNDYW